MRLLVVTQYFPPEVGATQTRLGDMTASLARRGHDVTVLTPLPHYPSGVVPRAYRRLLVREQLNGVRVLRTWVYAVPNRRVAKRVLDYASFAAAAVPAAALAGPFDVLFAETPPLFPGLSGVAIARLRRRPYVCNVADLWVDSAVEVGALQGQAVIAAARAAERLVLRRAARVTVVTEGIARAVAARGVPQDLVELIPNGVDPDLFRPGPLVDRAIGAPFTVLYAGNHGLAQGLATVLDAAQLLGSEEGVRFLLVGDGAEKDTLVTRARRQRIENVEFVDPQPVSAIPRLLTAADACVVPLRALGVLRGAVPSKLFEAMAAERPVILAAEGEAAALVQRAGAGLCVSPESPRELAEAVLRLRDDPELCRRLGEGGRRYVLVHHARERLVDAYERVLEAACAGSPASS